jgi:hypothetical protein
MLKKIRFVVIFFMLSSIFLMSLDKKEYSKLTDHDRILLSISFYEVGIRYRELGKTDLARTYIKESYEIENNVVKYYRGELQIPEKTINIDLNSIFDEKKTDNTGDEIKKNNDLKNKTELKSNKKDLETVYDFGVAFIESLKSKDALEAAFFFKDLILIKDNSLTITNNELKESIQGWIDSTQDFLPEYKIDVKYLNTNQYDMEISFKNKVVFFLALDNNILHLVVEKKNDKYYFTTISSPLIFKINQSSSNNKDKQSDNPNVVISAFIENIIKNDLDKAVSCFNEDVWLDDYKFLISSNKLKEIFAEWKKQQNDVKKISDVIELESLKEYKDNDVENNLIINLNNYDRFEVEFKTDPIFPQAFNKSKTVFIIDKIDDRYKIVSISGIN